MSKQNHRSAPVEPIGELQQRQVLEVTGDCLQQACQLFDLRHIKIPVSFDLRGRAAGMYQVRRGAQRIRYNPWIFALHYQANLNETVPHEVAHSVADRLFGMKNIRPHGKEWQAIMHALGVEPRATADFDLTGVPLRRQRRHSYHCSCREYELTTIRHNKICRHLASYRCRFCGAELVHTRESGQCSEAPL